ncbi:MAG: hypothetical protein JO316_02110 [Abitibacteriaceae bacterium]|nr:hypothetical protein [Abditibacteriaceae bacterium]MBV9864122.1 hypothetical protein [Abditibacteriaceae bacterium]
MKWWQMAALATLIFLLFDCFLGFAMHQYLHYPGITAQVEDMQDEKIGNLCGVLFTLGTMIIWGVAYSMQQNRDHD